jgi:hypothetical protein
MQLDCKDPPRRPDEPASGNSAVPLIPAYVDEGVARVEQSAEHTKRGWLVEA